MINIFLARTRSLLLSSAAKPAWQRAASRARTFADPRPKHTSSCATMATAAAAAAAAAEAAGRSAATLFSSTQQAASYSQHRPTYPPALFASILAAVPPQHRGLAVDVGTGSGQAAVELAAHFARVIGQDGSAAQLQHANRGRPNVEYQLADACAMGLPDGSVDLVTVAQALHWFSGPAFYREVRRVLAPHGVLACWTYGVPVLLAPDHPAHAVLLEFYSGTLGPYWAPERRHVERNYADIGPVVGADFGRLQRLAFEDARQQSLDDFIGYLKSWSAYHSYLKAHPGAPDPIDGVRQRLLAALGAEDGSFMLTVRIPLTLLLATEPVGLGGESKDAA